MSRSKAPLVIMEQVVMIGLFALAAAVCLRVFVYVGQSSKALAQEERMLSAARTVAEIYKAGDWAELDELGLVMDDEYHVSGQTEDGFIIHVTRHVQSEFYWTADIVVSAPGVERDVTLSVAGQEVCDGAGT